MNCCTLVVLIMVQKKLQVGVLIADNIGRKDGTTFNDTLVDFTKTV